MAPKEGLSENEHGAFEDMADTWAEYAESSPQFEYCYAYTLFKLVGNMRGKRVLDMPSGSGEQTERCLMKGAKHVTSADISPEQLAITKKRIEKRGWLERWSSIQGDACRPMEELQKGGHDILLAFFLFEYCSTEAELEQMAKNLFDAAEPGARLANLFFPCVNDPDSIKHVVDVVGAECTAYSPDIKPGDKVRITWHKAKGTPSMEVYHWPVDAGLKALEKAGFTQVRTGKMEVDPKYKGNVDLKKFAEHTENRWISAVKPLPDGSTEMKVTARHSAPFYFRSAEAFLKGTEAQEATETKAAKEARPPIDLLRITATGDAINQAVATATNCEAEKLGTITSVKTSYPELSGNRGTAQICITVKRI
eukprot:TRINITY_DN40525_c0_g1_i1.p1 TRINITY_DN40525_c0_g1~~TRINITY_DN40525_c0_g1_i1.p1  ORF type:complete len:366 (+),score=94.86 TRINITY_DN40525_c0_g1_i1:60-1157(+)